MSTQVITITKSSYYYMGLMNILSLLQKRITIIEGIFGEYFPDLKTSWVLPWNDDISPVLNRFGLSKMINNAMPDKPTTQGDGSVTPWSMDKSQAGIQAMYNMLNTAGVTFNPDQPIDALLTMFQTDPKAYQLRLLRCNNIMGAYETIHEIETSVYVISFSISPLYKESGEISRSPGQLLTIAGDTINDPYLFDITGLGNVEVQWESINQLLMGYFTKNYIDKTVFKKHVIFPSHSSEVHAGTISYASGSIYYSIPISSAGKVEIACINLSLVGIDGADNPISTQLKVNSQGIPGPDGIGMSSGTLYIGGNALTTFKDPSDIDYEIVIVYYST